jgi:hypothetical protein
MDVAISYGNGLFNGKIYANPDVLTTTPSDSAMTAEVYAVIEIPKAFVGEQIKFKIELSGRKYDFTYTMI